MRGLLAAAFVLSTVLAPPTVAFAQDGDGIEVAIEPRNATAEVGAELTLTISVANRSSEPSPALALHLDVTNPTRSGSVDPEDWTSTLTRAVASLDRGETRSLEWTVKPISGGDFRLYAVALPEAGGEEVWASNGVELDVTERRTLNPEGVLPVAIAAPVVVGGLLVTRVRRFRAPWRRSQG